MENRESRQSASLYFGMFLLSFASFLWLTPASYMQPGVSVMGMAGHTVGRGFAVVADSVNGQVTDFFGSQVAVLETSGESIALVGNTMGDGLSKAIFRRRALSGIAEVPPAYAVQAHYSLGALEPNE